MLTKDIFRPDGGLPDQKAFPVHLYLFNQNKNLERYPYLLNFHIALIFYNFEDECYCLPRCGLHLKGYRVKTLP